MNWLERFVVRLRRLSEDFNWDKLRTSWSYWKMRDIDGHGLEVDHLEVDYGVKVWDSPRTFKKWS